MEKISAACAMEWNIELEKGLRSKKPGEPIEAVLQIGPKLQQWSREPTVTMAITNMFGLVQGEDRLFANAILLRLADVFMFGDNHMRASVLKVFLLELKQRKKKGRKYAGILAKKRVPNFIELLKRVKLVFDTGNVESRALALGLLGCWADLGKDSAEIRYMILSSLESCHVLEVKASLFAAGCFCELSEDFACIVLEMLTNMLTSQTTIPEIKWAAAHAFAKMKCSALATNRAYQSGVKLVLGSSREEFVAEMLFSLSKLSLKSMLLIHEQVDLLLSFLSSESDSFLPTVLKCLHFISVGACCFPVNMNVLAALVKILDNPNFPLDSKCEVLRILHKVCSTLPCLPEMGMQEFLEMVAVIEIASKSLNASEKLLAVTVLIDISCILKRTPRAHWCCSLEQLLVPHIPSEDSLQDVILTSNGNFPVHMPWRVALLIIDQITLLAKHVNGGSHAGGSVHSLRETPDISNFSKVKQECQSLLDLLLCLVREYPILGLNVLDRVRYLIELLVNSCINEEADGACGVSRIVIDAGKPSSPFCQFEGNEVDPTASDIAFCLCRFVGALLEILDEADAITSGVYNMVKLLVELIRQAGFFCCNRCITFSLLLNSCFMCHCFGGNNGMSDKTRDDLNEFKIVVGLGKSHDDCWVDHEWMTLEFAKRMIAEGEFWAAYKAGKYAACQDAWFAALFAFRLLVKQAKSDPCRCWLESLALFAGAETEIQLLLFPRQGFQLISGLRVNIDPIEKVGQSISGNFDIHECQGKLSTAYNRVCSAEKRLAAAVTVDQPFYFQRWFMNIRSKVLETMVDILGLLDSVKRTDVDVSGDGQAGEHMGTSLPVLSQHMYSLVYPFSRLSFQLKRLAKELDLLASSFLGIDCKSFRTIARLALNCSLLAFCTTFALCFPNQPAYNNMTRILQKSERCLPSKLIQDLVERLWHIDSKTCTDLQLFLMAIGEPSGYLQARTQISSCGHRERATLMVCRFAVSSVLHVQEEAKGVQNEEDLRRVFQAGLQLLSNIVKKWMYIPFPTPKYFFRVRPCVGAELFAFNADTQNSTGISVSRGCHLSLNLCLQTRNVSPKSQIPICKLYCVIAVKASGHLHETNRESMKRAQSGVLPWNTDEMVDLNEELLLYMKDDGCRKHHRVGGDDGWVKAFVGFEASDRGQGFSTCLLDVSALSEGCYQIKWQGCCIDGKGSCWSLLPLNAGPAFCIY